MKGFEELSSGGAATTAAGSHVLKTPGGSDKLPFAMPRGESSNEEEK